MSRPTRRFARLLLLALCCLATAASAAGPAWAVVGAHVVLTSPVDGARWVRPETAILLRFDVPLAPSADRSNDASVRATGSVSGAHTGRLVLADNGRALIFRPEAPFAVGEKVTVEFAAAGTSPARWSFTTAGERAVGPTTVDRIASEIAGPATPPVAVATPPSSPVAPEAWLAPGPSSLPSVVADGPPDGLVFAAGFSGGAPFLAILDDRGYYAFYRQMPTTCFDFKAQANGTMTYFDSGPGKYMVMDPTFTVVDSVACGNGYVTDAHELLVLPDGHDLLLGDDAEVVDMRQYVPGGNPAAVVVGNVIQELDQDRNVVFEWRTMDHFQITDATHEDLTAATIDATHANALDVDSDGSILLSCRHLDEVTKIDRTDGHIVWRLGGKNNQFALVGDTQWFSHQHAARRIANGHLTLFDNGNYSTPQVSRALEYALDETNKVATLVWQYRHVPDAYGFAMGYVERLTDGTTTVSFGAGSPDFVRVNADGSVAATINLPGNYVSYRMPRLSTAAQVGVAPPGSAVGVALSNAVPNPCRDESSVFLTLGRPSPVHFAVFDVQGRKVYEAPDGASFGPGTYRFSADLRGQPAGVYFARVTTNRGTIARRLVRVR